MWVNYSPTYERYSPLLSNSGDQLSWRVAKVELDSAAGKVNVYVEQEPGTELVCPKCGTVSPGYDKRRRQLRHLDTCQHRTFLIADMPRVKCPEHGARTVRVTSGEAGSGFTALFEALAIDWPQETSVLAACRQLKLSWNAVDGIMQRAVHRGLKRREKVNSQRIAVDETTFRKPHDYVTVISDHKTAQCFM